jgi:CRISPR-associated protein Cas6
MTMTMVDLAFPLAVADVPRDHGYALYGALCRAIPELHEAKWLAVHPLPGKLVGKDAIRVGSPAGLRLRLPAAHIATVLPLAGTTLDVAGARLVLGAPTVHPLVPAASLDARLVVVKLTDVPTHENADLARRSLDPAAIQARVHAELSRQLGAMAISSVPEIRGRTRIKVAGHTVIGFSVRVQGLDADASLALQTKGLGGKRKMGGGVFRPTRGA